MKIPKVRHLTFGNIKIRLDNRFGVGEPFLDKIIQVANLPKIRLLLIFDTEDGFKGTRGQSFAMEDRNYAAPINGVDDAYDRKRIGDHNITDWRKWDYAVYIPKITAEKSTRFKCYFAFVLGHELEHVRIMVKNLEFHRCVSWLFGDTFTIFKEAGFDCKTKKKWEFPWELHCNQCGKKVAEDIFGKDEFFRCLTELIKYETDEHKEYLEFIIKLNVKSHQNDIIEHILNGVREYYRGIEGAVFKVWRIRKSLRYAFESQFDLKKFISLS